MQSYRATATELRHPVNVALHVNASAGVRVANAVTGFLGSWRFIILQTVIVAVWVAGNVYLLFNFDPYPFIFLNLRLQHPGGLRRAAHPPRQQPVRGPRSRDARACSRGGGGCGPEGFRDPGQARAHRGNPGRAGRRVQGIVHRTMRAGIIAAGRSAIKPRRPLVAAPERTTLANGHRSWFARTYVPAPRAVERPQGYATAESVACSVLAAGADQGIGSRRAAGPSGPPRRSAAKPSASIGRA